MNNDSEALQIRAGRGRKAALPELKSLIDDTPNFEEWDIYIALGGNRLNPKAVPFNQDVSTFDNFPGELVDKGYTHFIRFPRLPEVIRDPHQRKLAQVLSTTKDAMRRPGVHMAEVEEAGAKVWDEAEKYWREFYAKKVNHS